MNDQEESFDEKPTMSGGIQNKVFREMSFVNYMTTISSNEKGQILNMIQYGGLSILPLLLILKLMKFYIPVDDPLKSSSEILIEVVLHNRIRKSKSFNGSFASIFLNVYTRY